MERIPVYLDSNVIIDMANGREDELIGLILRSVYRGPYCYPFSAEQISELSNPKSDKGHDAELMLLRDISKNTYFEHTYQHIGFRSEQVNTVFNTINKEPIIRHIDSGLMSLIPFDMQVEARTELGLSTNHLNNLSVQEAIQTINTALANHKHELKDGQRIPPKSLDEMLEYSEKILVSQFSKQWYEMGTDPKTQILNLKIVSLFSLFDSFGFWSDSKSIYNKGSRFPDSRHAFNASFFDRLVSRDKRFLKKAEAVYWHLNIQTRTSNIDDFKTHLKEEIKSKS